MTSWTYFYERIFVSFVLCCDPKNRTESSDPNGGNTIKLGKEEKEETQDRSRGRCRASDGTKGVILRWPWWCSCWKASPYTSNSVSFLLPSSTHPDNYYFRRWIEEVDFVLLVKTGESFEECASRESGRGDGSQDLLTVTNNVFSEGTWYEPEKCDGGYRVPLFGPLERMVRSWFNPFPAQALAWNEVGVGVGPRWKTTMLWPM